MRVGRANCSLLDLGQASEFSAQQCLLESGCATCQQECHHHLWFAHLLLLFPWALHTCESSVTSVWHLCQQAPLTRRYLRQTNCTPATVAVDTNRRVYEKLCDEFASKRRERVVRLDIPLQAFTGPAGTASQRGSQSSGRQGFGVQGGGQAQQGLGVWGAGATGLDDLCNGLRDSIRAAFEARQAAYDAEVGLYVLLL
jgi:hypothetical protein